MGMKREKAVFEADAWSRVLPASSVSEAWKLRFERTESGALETYYGSPYQLPGGQDSWRSCFRFPRLQTHLPGSAHGL